MFYVLFGIEKGKISLNFKMKSKYALRNSTMVYLGQIINLSTTKQNA